ncbi:hypothetical protein F-S17_0217 [Faustovirus]|nr:hypothetical protein F-S17_0217 [Faustovirus]
MLNQINHFNTIGDLTGFALYFNMSFVMLGCIPAQQNYPQFYGWIAAYGDVAYYGQASDGVNPCANITSMPTTMPIKSITTYDYSKTLTTDTLTLMGGYLANFYVLGELKYAIYMPKTPSQYPTYVSMYWYTKCDGVVVKQFTTGTQPGSSFCSNDAAIPANIYPWNLFDCINHYFKKFKSSVSLTN